MRVGWMRQVLQVQQLQIHIVNSVCLVTRVRVDIRRAIAKQLATERWWDDIFLGGAYNSQPILYIKWYTSTQKTFCSNFWWHCHKIWPQNQVLILRGSLYEGWQYFQGVTWGALCCTAWKQIFWWISANEWSAVLTRVGSVLVYGLEGPLLKSRFRNTLFCSFHKWNG
jgi:hypothetical protein